MEPLFRSVRELPARFWALPTVVRFGSIAAVLVVAALVVGAAALGSGAAYQYAFTNLTPEDSADSAAALKASGIAFRIEAGGSALAVPANHVHDARLLLATAGLPRGGGVGFELFDRGDLGASEFTQRVNLRRATEGELARTIGRLSEIRSARVHLTLPERGLFRDEDRKASAAVVLNMQPGRVMQERALAGVRHLVASAVAGLDPATVTIVDGRGTVLSGDHSEGARLATQQREIESTLEQHIMELLEAAVGQGAVVAKVTAAIDTSEVETTSDSYDGDGSVVRSERKTNDVTSSDASNSGGVAGAAANQPLAPAAGGGGGNNRAQSTREEEVRNYEIPKKVTHTVTRTPRVLKLSGAVLVDGVAGKPRPEEEMRRLADLAKHAMGFDAQRGDTFDISSSPFNHAEQGSGPTPLWARPEIVRLASVAGVGLVVLALVAVIVLRLGRRPTETALALIKPGASVAELESMLSRRELGGARGGDANALLRDRARELGKSDPARAAHLLRAWIAADQEARKEESVV
jgi:flagellar M-ring protein FliF